jgi:hypothetical protein
MFKKEKAGYGVACGGAAQCTAILFSEKGKKGVPSSSSAAATLTMMQHNCCW